MSVRRSMPAWALALFAMLAASVAAGCGTPASEQPVTVTVTNQPEAVESGQRSSSTVIVVLGDSLAEGLGLLTEEAFPARLQELFQSEGYDEVEVVEAAVSGDTTAGGLRRVGEWLRPQNVRILVVALGGNDALRGLSVTQTRQNLKGIIDEALAAGVDVLLAGMQAPTNLGLDYQQSFQNAYSALAAEYGSRISFVPFLLEGVAGYPHLNQADGIHPNAEGARMIAEHLYQPLQNMVEQLPPLQ